MSNAFDITQGDLEDLAGQLGLYARKAVPFAARNGIKGSAFAAQAEWRGQLRRRLTLRNQHTTRSVRVAAKGTRGLKISQMKAITGSDASYMKRTETGGSVKATGQFGVPIPTKDARIGQSSKRVVSRPNRLKNIRLDQRSHTGGRRARNRKAIYEAKKAGNKFAFLELSGTRAGIFKISGSGESLQVRMVWSMDKARKTVTTPSTHSLATTLLALRPAIPAIYAQAMLEQLRRNTLFGYR